MADYAASSTSAIKDSEKLDSPESLVKWIHDQMACAKTETSSWRADMEEDFSFYSCDQWSQEDAAKLEEEGRPSVVFNRSARTINAVCGLEVQNRQEVRFAPRETDDNRLADYYTAVVRWVRDQCDAEDEDSEAFQDMVLCGMGWTQTRPDYDRDPDGMIDVSRFDPGEAFWDPSARKRNLIDRRWCARVKRYFSEEAIKADFPQYRQTIEASGPAQQYVEDSHSVGRTGDSVPLPNYDANTKGASTHAKEVICFNWFDSEPYYRVVTSSGQLVELSETKYARLEPQIQAMGLRAIRQRKRVYRHAYVCGNQLLSKYGEDGQLVLDEIKASTQAGFEFNCITGMRDRNSNTWFGLMRLMRDPQRWANKWLSQSMHILNSNSKGGLLAERDAFENQRKAEESWADPAAITWLKSGALSQNKIKEKTFAQLPQGFHQLMAYAVESISDTPGVSTELMGIAERNQPGVLEETRKRAGITMLAVFFSSLRLYRKEQGRVLADLVREYIADGRKIRIIGANGKPEVVALMRDAMSFSYDIVVADSPTSPSMKDKTFAVLREMLPILAPMGVPIPSEILDHSPLPADLVDKWKAALPQPGQPKPPPPEVMKAQMEMQLKQQTAQADLIAQQQKNAFDMQAERERMALEAEKEASRQRLERDKAVFEAQLKREAAEADMALEAWKAQQKLALDASVAAQKAALDTRKQAADESIAVNSERGAAMSEKAATALDAVIDRLNDQDRKTADVISLLDRLQRRRMRRVLMVDAQGRKYAEEVPIDE